MGAFALAPLWADRTVWPIAERTACEELTDLGVHIRCWRSGLAHWGDDRDSAAVLATWRRP
jgi:hypothetical protein